MQGICASITKALSSRTSRDASLEHKLKSLSASIECVKGRRKLIHIFSYLSLMLFIYYY